MMRTNVCIVYKSLLLLLCTLPQIFKQVNPSKEYVTLSKQSTDCKPQTESCWLVVGFVTTVRQVVAETEQTYGVNLD